MKIKTKEQRTSFDVAWWHENPQKLFNLSFHSFRSGILPYTWQIPNVPIMMLEIFWQTSSSLYTHTHTHTHTLTPHQFLPVRPHQMMLCRNFLSIFSIMAYFCLFFFVESIRVRSVLVPRGVAGCILEIPVSWSVPPQQPQLFATSKMLHRNDLGKDDDASDAWVASRVSTFFVLLFASAATTATTARTAVALNKYLTGKPQLKRVVATINPCLSDGLKSIAIPVEIKVDKTHQKVM